MKWNLSRLMVFIFANLFFSLANALPENYTFDAQHTSVLWHIDHFGFSKPSGKWMASGTALLDEENPAKSKVNVEIQMANVVTGIPELDKHLQGPLFFDVKKFPTAIFVSHTIEVTGKTTAKVDGILTLHGISKPVSLDVVLNKNGENPVTNKKSAGFSAVTILKRSDFGIVTLLPDLGDNVHIEIEAEAYKDK
jgi:polyisoprenoid-binding protein YceI